eukprot:gene4241-8435_t
MITLFRTRNTHRSFSKLSKITGDSSFEWLRACMKSPLNIKGIGPVMHENLQRLGISRVWDLLIHLPRDIVDRSKGVDWSNVTSGEIVTVQVEVTECKMPSYNRPLVLSCLENGEQPVTVNFFARGSGSGSNPSAMLMARCKAFSKIGSKIVISGKITTTGGKLAFMNPDLCLLVTPENLNRAYEIQPAYALTEGLTRNALSSAIAKAFADVLCIDIIKFRVEYHSKNKEILLNNNSNVVSYGVSKVEPLSDWMRESQRKAHSWPTLAEALQQAHCPGDIYCVQPDHPARQRLAFDELVFSDIRLLLDFAKATNSTNTDTDTNSISLKNKDVVSFEDSKYSFGQVDNAMEGTLTSTLLRCLPFELTSCQHRVIREIHADICDRKRMTRLLQGDVGSGKTLVAIMALLQVVEAGGQGALLAPTELLAKQHLETLEKYSSAMAGEDITSTTANHRRVRPDKEGKGGGSIDTLGDGVIRAPRIRLLTGTVQGAAKTTLLEELCSGKVDILVGTHSLINSEVMRAFPRLGLAVIDEEQRFGVVQKEKFSNTTNVLYVTATPIPRTLRMLDLNSIVISTLNESPPRRRPIRTILLPLGKIHSLIDRLQANINVPEGSKAFWVTPNLEAMQLRKDSSAEERYSILSSKFPNKVDLIHGALSSEEKDQIMSRFVTGHTRLLVATTVVEVGVDVPDASFCIIERAELFGLSQLHQIRGRVGRGDPPPGEVVKECFCVLLYDDSTDDKTKRALEKLSVLQESTDGFKIAEADLVRRGPGDVLGVRQKGLEKL